MDIGFHDEPFSYQSQLLSSAYFLSWPILQTI